MHSLTRRSGLALAAAALTSLSLTACGSLNQTTTGGDAEVDKLQIIIPADPGGGWDQTGRAMQDVLESEKLVSSAQAVNVTGAGGTVGLTQLANEKDPNTLMVMGLVMIGAIETNASQTTLEDTTPIAKLTEEQEIIVVPADSPYKTLEDLVDDIEAKGRKVSIAGGSQGGTDHILAGLLLQSAGMDAATIAKSLNYIPYSGGGESLAALLGNKVSAGISGVGEYVEQIKAGKLRALAVSGEERVDAFPDVPTITESGIDLTLTNWRGVVAPGNISDEKAEALTDLVTEMHGSAAWDEVLEKNDWADAFQTDGYDDFIASETDSVQETLKAIGLVK